MSCNNGNCSSFGLEQEKYLLQAFSSEKTLAPRALIMAKIQAPRFYVRARQFDSGVFRKYGLKDIHGAIRTPWKPFGIQWLRKFSFTLQLKDLECLTNKTFSEKEV